MTRSSRDYLQNVPEPYVTVLTLAWRDVLVAREVPTSAPGDVGSRRVADAEENADGAAVGRGVHDPLIVPHVHGQPTCTTARSMSMIRMLLHTRGGGGGGTGSLRAYI